MKEQIKTLDLSKWELFSDRHNSLVYNSKDGRWMVKLHHKGFGEGIEEMREEQRIAKAVYALGVSTPRVGDMVSVGDSIGLIYERIQNKVSFARQTKNHPEQVEEIGRNFARACRQLHAVACDTDLHEAASEILFESRHDYLEQRILECSILSEEEKERVLLVLRTIPEKKNCVHGDLHTGNAIFNEKGVYIIDLGTFGYGNPDLDIGIFYNFTNLIPEFVMEPAIYCSKELGRKLWIAFAKEYFGIEAEEELAALDRKYEPVGALQMFEFHHRKPAPFIRDVLEEHLLRFL